MQSEENDYAKDDGGEQDFSDVIIEDLLVGVGGVAEVCLLLWRRFTADDGIQFLGYVLFYIHVLDSLSCSAEISLQSQRCSWGVPPFPGARVFITKVPLHYNYFFAKFCRVIPKRELRMGCTAGFEGLAAGGITLERRGARWMSLNWG
jgi:hypothetical protein